MFHTPRLERFLLSGRGRFISKLRSGYLNRKRQEFLYPNKPNNSFVRVATLIGVLTGCVGYNYLVYKRAKLVIYNTHPSTSVSPPPEQHTKPVEIPTRKIVVLSKGTNLTDEIIPLDKISASSMFYEWLFGKKKIIEVVPEEKPVVVEPPEEVVEEIEYVGQRKTIVADEVIGALQSLGIRDKSKLDKLNEALSKIEYVDQLDLHSILQETLNKDEALAFERLYYFSRQKYVIKDIQLDYDDSLRDIKINIVTGGPPDNVRAPVPLLNYEAVTSTFVGGALFYCLAKFRISPPTKSLHTISRSLGRISVAGFCLYGLFAVGFNKYLESATRPVPYTLQWSNGVLSKISCTHNCARRITTPASFLSSYFIPGTIVSVN